MALVFRVGARTLAVEAADVSAVARRPALTRVPQAPAALAGLGVLKGRATPVVELGLLLGESDAGSGGGQVVVLRGQDPVAVAVDHIEGVRESDDPALDWLDLPEIVANVFRRTAAREPGALSPTSAPEASAGERENALSFVQFALAGQTFAFPMAEVQAVVRAPAELLAIPEADPVVRGLTILGEAVLPVVELADLLGLPRPVETAQCRLFVVEIGGAPVGLRVERALGALRVESRAVSPAPAVVNRGAGEARVTAIARTPSGLTAILSAAQLFDEPTMMRLNALAKPAPTRQPQAMGADFTDAILVFRLGDERYGLPASAVDAVARAPSDLVAPPNAPAFLKGLMSHRGQAIPVIDARARFGAPPAAAGAVILVRRGAFAAGLLVDAVERLAYLPRSKLDRAPAFGGDAGELFSSVSAAELEGRLLLIVDADAWLGLVRRDLSHWSPRPLPTGRV